MTSQSSQVQVWTIYGLSKPRNGHPPGPIKNPARNGIALRRGFPATLQTSRSSPSLLARVLAPGQPSRTLHVPPQFFQFFPDLLFSYFFAICSANFVSATAPRAYGVPRVSPSGVLPPLYLLTHMYLLTHCTFLPLKGPETGLRPWRPPPGLLKINIFSPRFSKNQYFRFLDF